jgi:hypothetical protein
MDACIGMAEDVAVSDDSKRRKTRTEHPETGNGKSRGFSKAAKCAIVIGVGVAVVAAILGYKITHPLAGVKFGKM